MSFNVWTSEGLLSGFSGNSSNPSVLYEGNAQILSGTVFKMWYSQGPNGQGLSYAESTDGLTWTQYSSNPLSVSGATGLNRVYKHGSTYYLYASPAQTQIDVYTSTDGINFTLAKSAAIVPTVAWERSGVAQLNVLTVDGSGTWYGYYSGGADAAALNMGGYMGLATSTDGINWTKSASNPIIPITTTNFCWQIINGVYYGWSSAIVPGDPNTFPPVPSNFFQTPIFRFSATNPAGPWTETSSSTYYSTNPAELGNAGLGISPVDPTMVAANGNIYLYYSNTNIGTGKGVACAIANSTTFAQLVATYEGVIGSPIPFPNVNGSVGASPNFVQTASDSFTSGSGTNWTQVGGSGGWGGSLVFSTGNVQPGSTSVNSSALYTGTWANDQYSQVTVKTCTAVSVVGLMTRATHSAGATPTYYGFYWLSNTALGASGTWSFFKYVNGSLTVFVTNSMTLNVGDILTMTAVGTQIDMYYNGFLFASAVDSSIASGAPGITLQSNTAVADAQLSAWSGGAFQATPAITFSISGSVGIAGATVSYSGTSSGSVTADGSGNYTISGIPAGTYTITPSLAGHIFTPVSQIEVINGSITNVNFTVGISNNHYSVPDCRNFGGFPNNSVNVNGTLTYTVQTESRKAGAPVDSRTTKPTASGTYPQNSRTPGTYGPGE